MSIASLLFGGSSGKKYSAGMLILDVTLEETHSMSNEVTTNPVEEGLPTSDFVKPNPDVITMRGLASNARLPEYIEGAFIYFETGDVIGSTFAKLVELKESKEPFTVVSSLKTYTDMVIRSIDIPRKASDGVAIEYTIDCIQVRRVSSKTISIPPGISSSGNAAGSVGGNAKPEINLGQQQNKPYNPKPGSKPESFLHGLLK